MTIYHFTNETFGSDFFAVFKELKEQNPKIKIILVFSTLSYSKFEINFPALLKWNLKTRYRNQINSVYDQVIVTKNVNDLKFLANVTDHNIGFITGFNQIFSFQLISKFHKVVNFHPSLLPYYRGPVPSYWVLHYKEKFTGFTIHFITDKIDQGEVLVQKQISVQDGETVKTLDKKIAELGAPFFLKLSLQIINNQPISKNILNAKKIYLNHIDYKTFPEII